MNKFVMGIALTTIAIASIAAQSFVSATTVSGNAGSIVKISNTCADLANVASNNKGSIVEIDGGGQCDINDILNGAAINNNAGSYIKISNVCGNTSTAGTANNNAGSIIKIESNGPCKKDTPTTIVVTEKETPKHTAAPESDQTVTELPQTGLGLSVVASTLAIGGAAYIALFAANRFRIASFIK